MSSHKELLLGVEGELIKRTSLEGIARLGLVGCGAHAYRNILPVLQYIPEAKLIATCDLNREKALLYAKQFGADHYFTDVRSMISSVGLDAILAVVGFNPNTGKPRYPEVVPPLLRRGIPVWFEKPPAASAQDLQAIIDAAEEGKTFAQVGFKMMFAPAVEKVHSIINSESFGKPQSFTASYAVDLPHDIRNLHDPGSRRFLDDIVHMLSQLELLFGTPSICTQFPSGNDSGFAVLEYENDLTGILHMKGGARIIGPDEQLEIVGEGSILNLSGGTKITHHQKGSYGSYGREISFLREDKSHTDVYSPELRQPLGALSLQSHALYGYIGEIKAFVQSVLNNTRPKKAGLEDALDIMQVYDAFSSSPKKRFRVGKDEPRSGTNPEIPIIRNYFTCASCGNQKVILKDGWSVVCPPPSGCGRTLPVDEIEKEEVHINKKGLIERLLAKCKEDGYELLYPALTFSRSGNLRNESPRIYLSVSPSQEVGEKYFVKIPMHSKDSVLYEAEVLKSKDTTPFKVAQPLEIIEGKSIVFEYIKGTHFDEYLKEKRKSGNWRMLNGDANLEKIVTTLAKFHEKNIKEEDARGGNVGFTHQDFDPFNILITKDSGEVVLFDWEDFNESGYQILDLIHFIMMSGVIYFPEISKNKLANAIISDTTEFASFARGVIEMYSKNRNVNPNIFASYLPVYAEAQIERLERNNRDSNRFIYPYLLKIGEETPLWLK